MDCAFLEKWLINETYVETVVIVALLDEKYLRIKGYVEIGVDLDNYYNFKN